MCSVWGTALEDAEDLGLTLSLGLVGDDVEADGLGEGAALADSDDITNLDVEGGGAVGRDVGVALLETVVLADEVEVVAADDEGAGHLGGLDDTLEDGTTDGNVAGEGALLVNIGALNGGAGGLEAETNVAEVADAATLLKKK